MSGAPAIALDEHGRATLDGTWELIPGDRPLQDLTSVEGHPIEVPGLWEAQGWLELDGPAWYRRRFTLDDVDGHWTLRFGAVMDTAEVHLNDQLVGTHEQPFTPFELDVTHVLRTGDNHLAVRVVDHPLDSPEHPRSAHGKQGWANHVFPSRPSLYMTYGGIWQSVSLRRHGPVRIDDVFLDGDPDDLHATIELQNVTRSEQTVRLGVRAVGRVLERSVTLAPQTSHRCRLGLGRTAAARWRPGSPALHTAIVDVVLDGVASDLVETRFGLRRIEISGTRLLIDGVPYRMKSALVQGFRADTLYAEGDRASIEGEVRAAQAMGFNTLRLHIKAFDPTYLEVCDELGMLVHCDLPVAEPIAHAEMGDDTPMADRCAEAVREQIRRDRNHPSVILWSAMNELTLDGIEWRSSRGYEGFARRLSRTVREHDPTRPHIENDWVEPEPERVFDAPVLTAHWYGRLHSEYLAQLEASCERWRDVTKPLFVTEFGDWGLPDMPELDEPPFWDTRSSYAAGLAATLWPGSISRFVRETQRYQGTSDRLQGEVFRRHDHLGGYCLTELTDVPHELNGLLDLHRNPKPLAVAEVERLNQPVLPMLTLEALVVAGRTVLRSPLHVANDGPVVPAAEVRIGFTGEPDDVIAQSLGDLPAHRVSSFGSVRVRAPGRPGRHDLVVELLSGGALVSANRYPVHVVVLDRAPFPVQPLGGADVLDRALEAVGATASDDGPLVVAEGALDAGVGAQVAAHLAAGGTALVLAQSAAASDHYPLPVAITDTTTEWGSSEFHFTTDLGALPSLPRRNLLVGEDATIQARSVLLSIGGEPFPHQPAVIAYKPVPVGLTGTLVGAHAVGPGRLVFCQYRLTVGAIAGDAAARSLLTDLVSWAAVPRARLHRDDSRRADGRVVRRYSWGSP